MSGTNETLIGGLRFHVSGTTVHVHDDNRKLKFEGNAIGFKQQVEIALKELEKTEGIIKISGTKDDLCIVSDGKKISLFLSSNQDVKSDLNSFLILTV
jgi:hypothetical protein